MLEQLENVEVDQENWVDREGKDKVVVQAFSISEADDIQI